MPDDVYEYDDDSYAALGAAGIDWRDADYVLRWSRPYVRKHEMVTILSVTGRDPGARWLTVMAVETRDDTYLVIGGRYLEPDEARATAHLFGLES